MLVYAGSQSGRVTYSLTFTLPQVYADIVAQGLSVLDDLVFDRAAAPDGGVGLRREDPRFPTRCVLFAEDESKARKAKAMVEVIAELGDWPVPTMDVQAVAEADWVALTQHHLPPVIVGPFYLRGSHSPPAPAGFHDLLIEAGLAFGTGHHETTRGCLTFLAQVLERWLPHRALDMGCGSAVLAMAAVKAGVREAVGIELDGDSVAVARENTKLNDVQMRVYAGDTPDLGGGTYDLIFANILAGPLIHLAPGLTRVAEQGADLLLAGMLVAQEAEVMAAYAGEGWALRRKFHEGQWSLLNLYKP